MAEEDFHQKLSSTFRQLYLQAHTASDIAKYLSEQSGLDYDEAIRGGYDDDS